MENTLVQTEDPSTDVNKTTTTAGDDVIKDPIKTTTSTPTKTSTGTDGEPGELGKRVGEVMDQTQATFEAKLAAWRPRIQKVTDPVAFMTSGEMKDGKESSVGNYDRAVNDRNSDDGFYELAKAECAALSGEISLAAQGIDIEPVHMVSLQRLSVFLEAYGELYAAIQDTGMSASAVTDPAKRAALAQQVDAQVLVTRAAMAEVPPDALAGIDASVASALDEISLFVSSWSTISAASEQTEASPYMWGNFLQTIERYRSILNEYDKLEERGGDNTGTANLAIRKKDGYYAENGDDADQAALDEGGYMAFALRSYGMHPEQAQKYIDQLKEIVARLKAGEFATQQECVAAFREHVGGGRASELFYSNLEKLAQGQWNAYLAGIEADLEKESYDLAKKYQLEASTGLGLVDGFTELRDEKALSSEKNDHRIGMTEEELYERGLDALEGKRDVVNHKYDPRNLLGTDLFLLEEDKPELGEDGQPILDDVLVTEEMLLDGKKSGKENSMPIGEDGLVDYSNYTFEMEDLDPDGDGWYETVDEWGNISYFGPDTAFVNNTGPSHEQLVMLGQSTMSDQQHEHIGMDQEGADKALAMAAEYQKKAQEHMRAARLNVEAAGDQLEIGLAHALMARKYLTEARLHGAAVESTHPALVEGLSMLDDDIAAVELKLSENADYRAIIEGYQADLESIIASKTTGLEAYDPQRLEVPLPTAKVDGVELTSKLYSKITIDLSGPAWWPFFWMGGVSGEYSTTSSTDPEKDGWSAAKIEAYAGLAAKLWVVEAGVKVKGYFEARKKNAEGLVDTVDSGIEELGRWAYAWWYDLDSMSADADAAMLTAKSRIGMMYDKLNQDASDSTKFESTRQKSLGIVDAAQSELAVGLISAFSGEGGDMLSLVDALVMTGDVLPAEDVKKGIEALEGAKEEEARSQIASERKAFESTTDKARKEAVGEISLVDPGQNDPNVKFEAGVGIEGFAGITISKAVNVKLGVSRVWYITDGDGEDFDFDVKTKDIVKLNAKIGSKGWNVAVTGKPSSKGWEMGLEVTIPTAHESGLDGSDTLVKVRNAIQKVEASSLEAWANGILKVFEDDDAIAKQFQVKTSSSILVKIGGTFKLDNDWDLTGGSVSFGIASKIATGNAMVKVSFETGNKVTLSF